MTNRRCQRTATPNLPTQGGPVARRNGPGSVYRMRKITLNRRAIEARTESGPDTKVGVKVQAASRPPYDHPTALKPHVQQPTVVVLFRC